MKRMRGFRSLQSRLTLNYALVTTVASALALALLFSVFAILLFNTDELPLAFAQATALQANDVRERILMADSGSVTRWLADREREDNWSIIDQAGLQYGVNLGPQGDAVLTVLANDGQVIGSTHAANAPGPTPIEAELIAMTAMHAQIVEDIGGYLPALRRRRLNESRMRGHDIR
mgnify:CR=1 FL=1